MVRYNEENASFEKLDMTSELKFQGPNRRKQCLFAAAVVVVVAVALTVGLVVGLRHKGGSEASSSAQEGVNPGSLGRDPLLLVSLDGFRASYLTYNVTPHLQRLIQEGVHTPRLLPAYPSLTFPNHYTMVTGLYPESHGIVDNNMFDIHLNQSYSLGSPAARNKSWYGGEPIWQTAQKQGKRGFCYFWVGSDVDINGKYPDEYLNYNGSVPWSERVDTVLEWLSRPADRRPHLVTLYYEEPDHTGHEHGPNASHAMLSALKTVDDGIGRLIAGLEAKGLYDSVNIIIVSDHGMASRSCTRQVKLSDYLRPDALAMVYAYNGAAGRISNKYSYASHSKSYTVHDPPLVSREELLQNLSGANEHMDVYDKRHLPTRLHYAKHHRIDDIILLMDNEWIFNMKAVTGRNCSGGTHGWDSRFDTMSALFIARGPAFKVGEEVPPFENIQLYSLMADLLNITAAPNNGTQGALYNTLRSPPSLSKPPNSPNCKTVVDDLDDIQKHCNCSDTVLRFQPQQASPIGQPSWTDSPSSLCLTAPGRTTLFSTLIHMPLWTAFTVTKMSDVLQDGQSCIVPSNNLPPSEMSVYHSYTNDSIGVSPATLFASLKSCGNVASSSDVLPMKNSLKEDLWQELWLLLKGWLGKNRSTPVSVTVGPVFDYNFDGLADNVTEIDRFVDTAGTIPLPSHYFVVLMKCPQQDQARCNVDLDILSFVLPNRQSLNGKSAEYRLMENKARLRDVELLTGLTFLTAFDPAQSARLRTRVPDMWTKPAGGGNWTDDFVCPEMSNATSCPSSYKPLLLISLDGFRADYLVKYNRTPVIDKLIQCGVHAPYMRSVYPTLTFPNHYSVVTGLYPESHGIIDNTMYDLDIGQKFSLGSPNAKNPKWWGGEPLWLTAQRQGKKAATFFWPGSDVPIQGEYPNYYRNYSGSVTYPERVNTVLKWLRMSPDNRPDFLTLYFSEPDHAAHEFGPDSPQVAEQLAVVDEAIGELMQGLYEQGMLHCINLIIIADHGMSSLSCDRMVVLSADIPGSDLGDMYIYEGPVGRISNKYRYNTSSTNIPIDPPKINISTIVGKLECGDTHMRVFTKEQLPMRLHYTNNKRIDDIILDADDQWVISRSGATSGSSSTCFLKGNHGYDNLYASMHALFLAYGPAFKSNVTVPAFENIELYNLMSDLIGVTPALNNGTEGTLFDILRFPPRPSTVKKVLQVCGANSSLVSSQEVAFCQCSHPIGPVFQAVLGEPQPEDSGPRELCITRSPQYVGAYNRDMLAPAWVIFSGNSSYENSTTSECIIQDPFLENTTIPVLNASLLQDTPYVPASLLFGVDDSCNATMSSVVVPMLEEFKTGIWRDLKRLVAHYSSLDRDVVVTVGPLYNYDASGLWQSGTNKTKMVKGIPVPSHFFVVLARCNSRDNKLPCWEELKLLSFIIPHVTEASNCLNFSAMLREHVARVRDVEIAAGLRFFPDLALNQSARLRTFLPTELWGDSPLITHIPKQERWLNQSCPPSEQEDQTCPTDYRPLLLVSMDGFKPQYLHRGLTPVMDRLLECGVHAPYMRSVYPTKTFPNHYTITSGLYPESHGIIDNSMFDSSISDRTFSISSQVAYNPHWWGGDPIWLTAQRQNKSAASFFWVGSDVAVQGTYPNIVKFYNGAVPFSSRVSTVVQWLQLPKERRPDLLMLYFDEPDHTAHTHGTFTPQVDAQIRRVDATLGELMDSLYQNDLHHCVNIMLVSDHGFSNISCDKVVELNQHLDNNIKNNVYYYMGPFGRISNAYHRLPNGTVFKHPGSPPVALHTIQEKLRCLEHMKVYLKTDLPKRHHYANNGRIDDIILDLAMNWTVSDKVTTQYCTGGAHGWDNTYKAMEALFLGYGPVFRNGLEVRPFENIELYNLMSEILHIVPSPNNGTEGSLDHLLWRSFNRTRNALSLYANLTSQNVTSASVIVCNCSDNSSSVDISEALNSMDIDIIMQKHLPFGAPLLMSANMTDVTLLYQPMSVTAYSSHRKQPLWVSTSVNASMQYTSSINCVASDPRINSTSCEEFRQTDSNYTYVSLLPSGYDFGPTSSLLSTFIPMYEVFYNDTWLHLQTYLNQWSTNYTELNIIAGTAFDANNDGLADSETSMGRNGSIPTDVFVVVTRCQNSSVVLRQCQHLQTLTFLLSQLDTSKQFNCQTAEEYLVDNEARVRDAELLAGLHFFPNLDFTQAVALRTYLPSGLWLSQ